MIQEGTFGKKVGTRFPVLLVSKTVAPADQFERTLARSARMTPPQPPWLVPSPGTYRHPQCPPGIPQLWVLPHSPANTSSAHSRGSSMVPAQSRGRSCWKSPSMQAASYISVAAPSGAHPCPSQLPHGGTLFLIPVSSNGGILLFLFLIPIFF